jgi:hypothetical protein
MSIKIAKKYEKHPRNNSSFIFYCCFTVLIIVVGIIRLQIFRVDTLRTWLDTKSYIDLASHSVFQLSFWIGNRPPLLPLIYKALGGNVESYTTWAFMNNVVHVQLIISYVSWVILAFSVSNQFRSLFSKVFSSVSIMFVSLSIFTNFWDKLLLSESISNSLFVLLISFWFFALTVKNRAANIFLCITTIVVATLYCMVRDSNPYFVLFAGFCLLGYFGLKKVTKQYISNKIPYFGVVFIFLFALSFLSATSGQRSKSNITHVLADGNSIPKVKLFFAQKGIDLAQFSACATINLEKTNNECEVIIQSNKELIENSSTLYYQFLITHPGYVLSAPLKSLSSLLSPISTEYRHTLKITPEWIYFLGKTFTPIGNWVYPATIVFSIIGLTITAKEKRKPYLILAFLFLSIFPMALLIFHADTLEIERHAQQLFLQSRLCFWLSCILLVDALKSQQRNKRLMNIS